MIPLKSEDVETLKELIEAARECYATALVYRATHGESPLRSNIAMQRLNRAVQAADQITFKPQVMEKETVVSRKPRTAKAAR